MFFEKAKCRLEAPTGTPTGQLTPSTHLAGLCRWARAPARAPERGSGNGPEPPPPPNLGIVSPPWEGDELTQTAHETFDSRFTAVTSRQDSGQAWFALQSSKAKEVEIVTVEHDWTE